MEYPKFKVCVRCFTFNQSKYITDALNGFCMQKTGSPFVCCIVDDASTDGEQDVINKYLENHFDFSDAGVAYKKETDYAYITFAQHKGNKNCYFAVLLLKENHYKPDLKPKKFEYISEWRENSEYEAMCEGDDYWIDPSKLQLQVEYMDSNQDCGLCYTDFNILNQKTGSVEYSLMNTKPNVYKKEYKTPEEFVLDGGYVGPMTWVERISLIPDPKDVPSSLDGTFVRFTYFLCKSKAHYLDYVTATYRIVSESASHTSDPQKWLQREKNLVETKLKLIDYYNLPKEYKKLCLLKYYKGHLVFLLSTTLQKV